MDRECVQLVWGLCGGLTCNGTAAPARALLPTSWGPAGTVPGPGGQTTAQYLSLGWSLAVALDNDGSAHVADTGELFGAAPSWHPAELGAPGQRVLQVSAGEAHCLLLDVSGCVWALGSNRHGQLGVGSSSSSSSLQPHASYDAATTPQRVMGPGSDCTACHDPVAHIAAGGHHSAALCRRLGRCYTWGCNSQGQLGHGTAGHMNCAVPALVRALDGVPLVSVAAGLAHTAVVSRDGDVYTWGCNCTGELGLREEKPEEQRSLLPAQQPQQKQVQPQLQQQQQERLGAGGGWHQRLASAVAPVLLEHPCLDEEHVTQVAAGTRHTVALTASGRVIAWGLNKHGQCGQLSSSGDEDARVPSAAPGRLTMPESASWMPWYDKERVLLAEPKSLGRPLHVSAHGWLTTVLVSVNPSKR